MGTGRILAPVALLADLSLAALNDLVTLTVGTEHGNESGFVYLVAVIDGFSRYVLSWAVSITMDVLFCLEALEQALKQGPTGNLRHRSRGPVYQPGVYRAAAEGGVRISMDSRGRALDNVFVERLWRSVKYEEVYLRDYQSVSTRASVWPDILAFTTGNGSIRRWAIGRQRPYRA